MRAYNIRNIANALPTRPFPGARRLETFLTTRIQHYLRVILFSCELWSSISSKYFQIVVEEVLAYKLNILIVYNTCKHNVYILFCTSHKYVTLWTVYFLVSSHIYIDSTIFPSLCYKWSNALNSNTVCK